MNRRIVRVSQKGRVTNGIVCLFALDRLELITFSQLATCEGNGVDCRQVCEFSFAKANHAAGSAVLRRGTGGWAGNLKK